ncbi:hypothetical protein AXF42_Ash020703 [Apostasia shenzhenica]|uniref:Uncharacterized protein n=1 Tax=Apostasia shenzhenica TaxID=1088818 RepID=A0A2H9ZYA0_9ASPA|nr:hypothetical protein AXF42_Ash020703 [Apostasia shenzhenica]
MGQVYDGAENMGYGIGIFQFNPIGRPKKWWLAPPRVARYSRHCWMPRRLDGLTRLPVGSAHVAGQPLQSPMISARRLPTPPTSLDIQFCIYAFTVWTVSGDTTIDRRFIPGRVYRRRRGICYNAMVEPSSGQQMKRYWFAI